MADESMHEAVAAIAACGVSPVVRVAEGQHWMIKRALDAGAHGIIVPLLQNVEDAKNIAKYSKFPPVGNRGLGSALSMEKFITGKTGEVKEVSMADYFRDSNSSTVVVVQIETASALEQVNEIAAVDGIDVLFIGPTDLGNMIGHPSVLNGGKHSPELDEAIAKINKAAHDAGKYSGVYMGTGEQARQYADMGFNMINAANDQAVLRKYFAEHLATAQSS
jgi:4-hydroxy-2-oxoheptanedioate aldolase